MAYTTRCICDDHQIAYVGCDCDHTGPERVVKTEADLVEEAAQAYLAQLDRDEKAMIAYFEAEEAKESAKWGGAFLKDAREDFAEYTLNAARHQ
jgi:hypothetical protein